MHRCPQCDYALGPIAGVPTDRFGPFTAAVRCPECGFEIPEGSRLLVGSVTAVGVQPLTRGRRVRQVAIAVLPMLWFLHFGVRGLAEVVAQGPRNLSAWSVLKAASLVAPCLVLWTAWRYWSPKPGEEDAGAQASRDMRWLCTPGALLVYHGSLRDKPDARGVDLGTAVGARGQVQVVRNASRRKRIDAGDVTGIRVYSTEDTGRKRRTGDRIAARLVADAWERDRDGRRTRKQSWEINIDTAAEPGPPGTDHAAVAIEAGDRIANLVRQSLGLARRAQAPTAADAFGADPGGPPLVIDGSRYALPPWHAQRHNLLMAMTVPLLVTVAWPALLIVHLVDQLVRANRDGIPVPGPPIISGGIQAVAGVGTACFVAVILGWWLLARRARRRDSTLCRWEVGAGGIRVTETECDRGGEPRRESVVDVPAWEIASVGAVTTKRRIRLVASDHARKELASVTLDEIPEGGADELAGRVAARLRLGQPG
jgi:hypothetical protein